jgi:uncharacterized cofD-like protein
LPRRSLSSRRIVLLGAGRGLAAVLAALRDEDAELTVIVSVADDARSGRELRRRMAGSSVDDLRRSLEALTGDEAALARAFRRPLKVERLGRHPLGNLVVASLATAFGDYGRASIWLGEQLGIAGTVLPATTQPVQVEIENVARSEEAEGPHGSSATGPMLRFVSGPLTSPPAAVEAIERADWVLLAPGSLFRSVLSTSATPELSGALELTSAPVVWIANLQPDLKETADMKAVDHLLTLRRHAVRVDSVIYDPSADLTFVPEELASYGVKALPRVLVGAKPGRHDPERLRAALRALIGLPTSTTTSTAAERPPD